MMKVPRLLSIDPPMYDGYSLHEPHLSLYRDAARARRLSVVVELGSAAVVAALAISIGVLAAAMIFLPDAPAHTLAWSAVACFIVALAIDSLTEFVAPRLSVRTRTAHQRFMGANPTGGTP